MRTLTAVLLTAALTLTACGGGTADLADYCARDGGTWNCENGDLSGLNLSGLNLKDANLSDATLSGADLSGCTGSPRCE